MPTKKKTPIKNPSVRLVPHVKPEKYTLVLKPDLEAFTFSGKEVIDIIINNPPAGGLKEITLHSKDIKIDTVEVSAGKEKQFATKISYNTNAETSTFLFKKGIPKGKAKLTIVFEGVINETLRGFYKSKYTIDGVTKHLATTQFEATDARRCFPCFDEPAQKAVFDVSLIIPGSHTAISNTLPTSTKEHEGGYKVVTFAPTPRMSTYLLAFIVGEFEYIEGFTKDKVQVRVFTTQGKKHQAKFALEVAIKSLEFYNEYFNIAYPLPTLDMIAIPDFESGAMENWGAVTYRETAILVDEKNSSLSNKQWVALVIAHELAHQWFGNLVTMEWWTDLWLNEGFASYIEYLAVDHIFPTWKIWDQFLTSDMAAALRLDALKHSHPIEVTVHHPDEINEIFDMVSYAKGATVIRMLASYLGEEKFRIGLQHYLKKHSYKNTVTLDLWKSFEAVSKKPVSKLMQNWTSKTGYPLLTTQNKKNKYSISQERFFSSRISKKATKENTLWYVPFMYESNTEKLTELLTKKSAPLIGTSIGKVNSCEQSLVRVRYDKDTLARLKSEIENNTLSVHDRLGIIRDLFALAEGGYISTVDALKFSRSYKKETEYIVWAELAAGIDRVRNIITGEKFVEKYDQYAASLFKPLTETIGWQKIPGEDHSQTFLRSLILSHAGFYGDKTVVKEALLKWKNRNAESIDADIRGLVYAIVARNGSLLQWKEFQTLYKNTEMHEEKERYGRALAQFTDKKLLVETLRYAFSDGVRDQDAPFMIGSVWQNSHGRDLTWKFVKQNWKTILKRYGEGGHFLSRLLSPLGNHIKVKDALDAKKFFKSHAAPGADRTLEQVYERIYSNAAWLAADKKSIEKFLKRK